MLTVGELRAAIADLPDDALVLRWEMDVDLLLNADRVMVGANVATFYRAKQKDPGEWLPEGYDHFTATPDADPGASIRRRPAVAIY